MPRVLVVDDERQIVKLVEINLRKAGYDVICAYDGAQALGKAQTEAPDLIVLDAMLPDMSGSEVLRQLRSDPETRQIPVIMLGKRAKDTGIPGRRPSGISSWLTKPFDPRHLLDEVDRVRREVSAGFGQGHYEVRGHAQPFGDVRSYLLVSPPGWPAAEIATPLRRSGFSVTQATSLEGALTRIRRRRPDRVLVAGFDTEEADAIRRAIREQPETSHTPVLVLTGPHAVQRFLAMLQ